MAVVIESFCGHTRCWPKVLTDESFVHMEMLVTTSSQSMQHPIDAHMLAWSVHQSGVRCEYDFMAKGGGEFRIPKRATKPEFHASSTEDRGTPWRLVLSLHQSTDSGHHFNGE